MTENGNGEASSEYSDFISTLFCSLKKENIYIDWFDLFRVSHHLEFETLLQTVILFGKYLQLYNPLKNPG